MPLQPKQNETLLDAFNAKYKININVDRIDNSVRKLSRVNNFLNDKPVVGDHPELRAYMKVLREAFASYVFENTKAHTDRGYDVSDFNLYDFVTEFEEVMSARDYSNRREPRKPYEGTTAKRITKHLLDNLKTQNKTLVGHWTSHIKEGVVSLDELKAVTQNAYEALTAHDQIPEGNMERPIDRQETKWLTDIIAAQNAMTQVRLQRGFWWKAFHLIDNYRENKYLEKLNEQIKTLRLIHKYPTERVENGLFDKMYQRSVDASEYAQSAQAKQAQKNNQAEQKQANDQKVADRLETITNAPEFSTVLTELVVDAMPQGIYNRDLLRMFAPETIRSLIDVAQEANAKFDREVASGKAPEEAFINNVSKIFCKAMESAELFGFTTIDKKLLMAQKVTDVVLKQASPAALDPQKFSAFTNGYVLNNLDKFTKAIEEEVFEPLTEEELKAGAEQALNAFNAERIEVDELAEVVPSNKEVPKIDGNGLQIKAPVNEI